jgi:hypothetical protein
LSNLPPGTPARERKDCGPGAEQMMSGLKGAAEEGSEGIDSGSRV